MVLKAVKAAMTFLQFDNNRSLTLTAPALHAAEKVAMAGGMAILAPTKGILFFPLLK